MQHRANNAGSELAVPVAVNCEGALEGPHRASLVLQPSLSGSAHPSQPCLLARAELWSETAGAGDLTSMLEALQEVSLQGRACLVPRIK